eukprot:m.23602 g.23602  ORF g.23602 m.23602 type:complete len:293 (-) comp5561_c0_seq1:154-1032(-)
MDKYIVVADGMSSSNSHARQRRGGSPPPKMFSGKDGRRRLVLSAADVDVKQLQQQQQISMAKLKENNSESSPTIKYTSAPDHKLTQKDSRTKRSRTRIQKKKASKKDTLPKEDIRQHFPVRLGKRVSEAELKKRRDIEIQTLIRDKQDSADLEIVSLGEKGKGVLANKLFHRGDFVCEYAGDLINSEDAVEREKAYLKEANENQIDCMPCYMYFFKHNNVPWCVDATKSPRIGRLINHSRTEANLRTKLFVVDSIPHLGLVAIKNIDPGEELLYDYGERDPSVLLSMPWLKK